jgi:hypothetical protein
MITEFSFEKFIGMTFTRVVMGNDRESLHFVSDTGRIFEQYHDQDCCEYVRIEDICGDLNDLVGSPILFAEESTNSDDNREEDSHTWTFYRIGTVKGTVVIRWLGTSNGYYSERVSLREIDLAHTEFIQH